MKLGKNLANYLNRELNTDRFKGSMTINLTNYILGQDFDGKYSVAYRDGILGVYGSYRHCGL